MGELKIHNHIADIQNWINNNISEKMSSVQMYPILIDNNIVPKDLNQQSFSNEMSLAVREGLIKGFYGVRGRFGGFVREKGYEYEDIQPISQVMPIISNDNEVNMAKEQKEQEPKFKIIIDQNCYIEKIDQRNLAVVVGNKTGYASSIKEALQLLVSKSFNKEIQSINCEINIKDLLNVIQQAETNILNKLK